jgi:hypothetical protein
MRKTLLTLKFIHSLTISDYKVSKGTMISMWKEIVVAYFDLQFWD